MSHRSRKIVVLATALALAGAPVLAAQAQETPAPDGTASATGAAVDEIVALSETSATAGSDSAEASASALEIGGEPPAEQFGGTQEGEGTSSGALVDPGEEGMGRVAVMPWSATVTDDGTERTAESDASLAEVTIQDEDTLHAEVLNAHSFAFYRGFGGESQSGGASDTDLLDLKLGGDEGLHLVVLHSEASSSGSGKVYLLSVNGNEIVSNEQIDGTPLRDLCSLEIPGALRLICVSVTGGAGSVTGTGGELTLGDPEGQNLPVGLFIATGTGSSDAGPGDGDGGGAGDDGDADGAGTGGGGGPTAVAGEQVSAGTVGGETARADDGEPGALAATGFDPVRWIVLGLSLMVMGGAMRLGTRSLSLVRVTRA